MDEDENKKLREAISDPAILKLPSLPKRVLRCLADSQTQGWEPNVANITNRLNSRSEYVEAALTTLFVLGLVERK